MFLFLLRSQEYNRSLLNIMMNKFRKIIDKHLSGKKVLLLFVVTNIVYVIMLTITIPKTMIFSGGMKLLDMMPMGYDLDYVNALFSALGEKGRDIYLFYQIPVDMIYPFLFAITYSLLFAFFLDKLGKLDSVFFYFSLLPLLAGAADYFENFGIIMMLNSFPNISASIASLTNTFSMIKSISTTIFFIALLIIVVSFGIKTWYLRIKSSN